jgi:hypothetical protein
MSLAKSCTDRRDSLRDALPGFGKRRFRRGEKKNEADKSPNAKGISDPAAHMAHIVVHWIDKPDSAVCSINLCCARRA